MDISQQFFESIYDFLGVGTDKKAVLAIPHVNCALGTTRGPVRHDNQDRAIVLRSGFSNSPDHHFLMFAISDGIGGMADGASCARITLSSFSNALVHSTGRSIQDRLSQAFVAANSVVYRKFNGKSGATLSVLLISKNEPSVVIGNVGDSRVYGFERGDKSSVKQLTIDDTIEARVAEIRHLNVDNMAPELKGRLAQYMGMPEGLEPSVNIHNLDSNHSLGFALTTDGVHDIASDTLKQIMVNCDDTYELAERLIDVAMWCGGNDNATVITVSPDTVNRFLNTQKTQRRFATVWSPYRQLDLGIIGTQKQQTPLKKTEERKTKPKQQNPGKGKKKSYRANAKDNNNNNNKNKNSDNLDPSSDIVEDEVQMSIEFIKE